LSKFQQIISLLKKIKLWITGIQNPCLIAFKKIKENYMLKLQTMLGLTWQSKKICMQSQYAKWLQFILCVTYIRSMISNRLNNHQIYIMLYINEDVIIDQKSMQNEHMIQYN